MFKEASKLIILSNFSKLIAHVTQVSVKFDGMILFRDVIYAEVVEFAVFSFALSFRHLKLIKTHLAYRASHPKSAQQCNALLLHNFLSVNFCKK